jgi:hypothetical protein
VRDVALLSQDQILAAMDRADIETKDVAVPELGGTVRVREMPGNLRNRLEATYATIRNGGSSKNLDKITAQILAVCVIDEHDKPTLTTAAAERMLQRLPRAAFRIRDAVLEISAVDEDDIEAMAEVFDDAQSDSSTTD